MRAYSIVFSDPNTGATTKTYSSWANDVPQGKPNPGALNVEIDALTTAYATPGGDAGVAVRIWGVQLPDIATTNKLVGQNIAVYGGMAKGLPLANPAQYGLLVQGSVYQAFGNWVGTNMTLDVIIQPTTGTPTDPINLSATWVAGTSLSTFLQNILSQALPAYATSVNISPNLISDHDIPMYYHTLVEFAQWVKQASAAIINGPNGGTYPGVDIVLREKSIIIFDGTTQKTPKNISFLDLVGQPTWIAFPNIQVTCIMRGDLTVGDFIQMPNVPIIATASALTAFKDKSDFPGVFQIAQLRHAGNFRQPSAESWVTVIEGHPSANNAAV